MTTKTTPLSKQRENWLNKATKRISAHWLKLGVTVPADVQLSCGFPGGGSPQRRIGECWPRGRSERGVNQVFVSPVLGEPLEVINVLGHELLHAVDNCASGHGKAFSKNSRMVGYSGGKHSVMETEAAKAFFAKLLKSLGEYPHGKVILKAKVRKPSNGLQKFECAEHGDVLYSTAKQAEERGAPRCRECDCEMLPVTRQDKKEVQTV